MTVNPTNVKDAEELERVLDDLMEVETFDPPAQFREQALIRDPDIYAQANADPEAYWAARARELHWHRPFTKVLDDSNPPFFKWFADGELNVSYNCVDRHVEAGHGDRVAYHWHGEEGEARAITYADLHRDVQRLASGLKDLGVAKGDVVAIFLPMIPEVVVAMLACARLGALHNVVFGGFSLIQFGIGWRFRTRRRSSRLMARGEKGRQHPSRVWSTESCQICKAFRPSSWCARPEPIARCRRGETSGTTSC